MNPHDNQSSRPSSYPSASGPSSSNPRGLSEYPFGKHLSSSLTSDKLSESTRNSTDLLFIFADRYCSRLHPVLFLDVLTGMSLTVHASLVYLTYAGLSTSVSV